jgi:hypothetical protein
MNILSNADFSQGETADWGEKNNYNYVLVTGRELTSWNGSVGRIRVASKKYADLKDLQAGLAGSADAAVVYLNARSQTDHTDKGDAGTLEQKLSLRPGTLRMKFQSLRNPHKEANMDCSQSKGGFSALLLDDGGMNDADIGSWDDDTPKEWKQRLATVQVVQGGSYTLRLNGTVGGNACGCIIANLSLEYTDTLKFRLIKPARLETIPRALYPEIELEIYSFSDNVETRLDDVDVTLVLSNNGTGTTFGTGDKTITLKAVRGTLSLPLGSLIAGGVTGKETISVKIGQETLVSDATGDTISISVRDSLPAMILWNGKQKPSQGVLKVARNQTVPLDFLVTTKPPNPMAVPNPSVGMLLTNGKGMSATLSGGETVLDGVRGDANGIVNTIQLATGPTTGRLSLSVVDDDSRAEPFYIEIDVEEKVVTGDYAVSFITDAPSVGSKEKYPQSIAALVVDRSSTGSPTVADTPVRFEIKSLSPDLPMDQTAPYFLVGEEHQAFCDVTTDIDGEAIALPLYGGDKFGAYALIASLVDDSAVYDKQTINVLGFMLVDPQPGVTRKAVPGETVVKRWYMQTQTSDKKGPAVDKQVRVQILEPTRKVYFAATGEQLLTAFSDGDDGRVVIPDVQVDLESGSFQIMLSDIGFTTKLNVRVEITAPVYPGKITPDNTLPSLSHDACLGELLPEGKVTFNVVDTNKNPWLTGKVTIAIIDPDKPGNTRTGTRWADGDTNPHVVRVADGLAVCPAIRLGETAGHFTISATPVSASTTATHTFTLGDTTPTNPAKSK